MKCLRMASAFLLTFLLLIEFSCTQSGRRKTSNERKFSDDKAEQVRSEGKSIVQMERESGVNYIWIEINGIRLRFIFDTGASNICISQAEAVVLYRQGTLKKEDILDQQYFQDATGRISAGTRINLRTVRIGNRELKNVEAIVIDNNEAPLLLGQSALERFGKISIDNQRRVIIFE